jgi:hypothetical protein
MDFLLSYGIMFYTQAAAPEYRFAVVSLFFIRAYRAAYVYAAKSAELRHGAFHICLNARRVGGRQDVLFDKVGAVVSEKHFFRFPVFEQLHSAVVTRRYLTGRSAVRLHYRFLSLSFLLA